MGQVVPLILHQQGKLIPSPAGQGVALAQAGPHGLCQAAQQGVALIMAEGAVVGLEVVQPQQQQGGVVVTPARVLDHLPQSVDQQASVGKPGQGVVEGQAPDGGFGGLGLGKVGQGGDVVGDPAVVIAYGADGQPLGV